MTFLLEALVMLLLEITYIIVQNQRVSERRRMKDFDILERTVRVKDDFVEIVDQKLLHRSKEKFRHWSHTWNSCYTKKRCHLRYAFLFTIIFPFMRAMGIPVSQ